MPQQEAVSRNFRPTAGTRERLEVRLLSAEVTEAPPHGRETEEPHPATTAGYCGRTKNSTSFYCGSSNPTKCEAPPALPPSRPTSCAKASHCGRTNSKTSFYCGSSNPVKCEAPPARHRVPRRARKYRVPTCECDYQTKATSTRGNFG